MPGDKDAKLAPYTATIFDQMYRIYGKEKIDKELYEGRIEVIPLGFMRGRNFTNCVVVIDEAQNATHLQTQLLLSRMCSGSKIIFCGDTSQIDLRDKKQSGFDFMCKHLINIEGFKVVTLKTNHRDSIVEDILKVYKEYDN
jgi:phosphate starvation-inducible PhoH-like protein